MKNLFILPSQKPSRLLKSQNNNFMIIKSDTPNWFEIILKNTYQNIYITNNDGLNENDYVITDDVDNYGKLFQVSWLKNNKIKNCYKVILTTDHDLIKNGVQAIDDEFLEWFIKNPSCEEFDIMTDAFTVKEMSMLPIGTRNLKYKIIIPKEEPKQDLEKEMFELEQELDIPSHLRWHNSKPKQETLEKAAENDSEYLADWEDKTMYKRGFIEGAEWQQERSYSEEDMKDYAEYYNAVANPKTPKDYFTKLIFKNK